MTNAPALPMRCALHMLPIALASVAAAGLPPGAALADEPAALVAKLRSPSPAERLAAEKALIELGAPAVPALVEMLQAREADPRASAAYVLGMIGAKAGAAGPALGRLARSGPTPVRIAACVALGQIGPAAPDATAALAAALGCPEMGVRRAAVWALQQIGPPAVPELLKNLTHDSATMRGWSAHALREIGGGAKDAVDALVRLLRTEADWSVRREAVLALGQLGPAASKAAATLVEAFAGDPRMRRLAASALGAIHADPNDILPGLLKAMRSPDTFTRRDALEALGRVGRRAGSARDAVAAMLRDDADAENRLRAAMVLADTDPNAPEVLPVLLAAMGDRESAQRTRAIWALHRFAAKEPRVLAAVAALLDEPEDQHLRAEAAWALGEVGPPARSCVPRLARLLADEQEEPRGAAAWALGRIGRDANSAAAPLRKCLDDPSPWVRTSAAASLHRLGDASERIIPVLIDGLKGPRPWIRADAAEAIVGIGPPAKAAAPLLEKMLDEEDAHPRMMAAAALHAIQAASPKARGVLLAVLKDRRDPWRRRRAAELLGELKISGEDVAAALAEAARDASPDVRKAAAEALRKIGGAAGGAEKK